jgi:hypothetical protein
MLVLEEFLLGLMGNCSANTVKSELYRDGLRKKKTRFKPGLNAKSNQFFLTRGSLTPTLRY